ncbi:anaerobic ribonucleoside-triphosphate reductase activating protein [Treponema sp.]|uniref:anaerobic ribonucleoside-triphosphate reductase activating protein n=1 Tax=Treponema sp. TaxID=166 RepID=UPI0025DDC738|nr:anaerobic ribonucleoside-triphosphate reductase activating protein [Treponema sp.]
MGKLHYGEIKTTDIANGEGVRVTLFVSGCRIHCKGCFNSMTWDFNYGKPYTFETEEFIIKALEPEYIAGLTVLGGEPMEPENQRVLVKLMRRVKETYPSKTIWCYSGYVYDKDLLPQDGKKHCEVTDELLSYINVLVDGPFILKEKDITLQFRGSRNQRILRLR